MNKAERDAFFRKGFMPYSIAVLDKKTGKYVSTSYARFDPISSLLAISVIWHTWLVGQINMQI